jgi:serine/threonine-protein kinase
MFVLRFVWWAGKWSFATVFFLAVMGAAGIYVFYRSVEGGAQVVVPAITGMPMVEAYNLLIEKGLEIGEVNEMANDAVPRNHVVAQRPAAGQVVREGRKVFPTISVGPELREAPSFVGMTIDEAREAVSRMGGFQLGAQIAHIPHDAPYDTVIGQDPAPGHRVNRSAQIHLLASSGRNGRMMQMPDLQGMTRAEVERTLARLELDAAPFRVQRADAPLDEVLRQDPPPGKPVSEGDTVRYWINTDEPMPDAWQEASFTYTVPETWTEQEVRVDVINSAGARWTLFPRPENYVNGQPPRFSSGQRLPVSFSFQNEATVEVYLGGELVRSYYYAGDAEPVVTRYDAAEGE